MPLGYFLIFLSATGFGCMPIFVIYAYENNVSLTTILFLRFAFASIFFFLYLLVKVKKWRITKHHFVSFLVLGGLLYTLQSYFYFSSVKYIPASLAALLLYLYPVFVAILSSVVNKEKVSRQLLISILISLSGIAFVLGSPTENINFTGILLAVAAAVVYSFYIIFGGRVVSQVSPVITSAFIALFASLSFLIGGLYTGTLHFAFAPMGWLSIAGIALFSSVIAMLTFFAGMNITGPTKASILSMVEPVITVGLSALMFQEKMSMLQMIGGLIVLAGAVLVVLSREKAPRTEGTTLSG
jgi:drug/metabolite transporter (DMT)-like permease